MRSVSLLDIVPDAKVATVELPGRNGPVQMEVQGVTGRGFGALLKRFPDLRKASVGMVVGPDDMLVTLIDFQVALIAAGLGKSDDEETEALADRLQPEAKRKLCEAIWGLTMPTEAKNPFSAASEDAAPALAEATKGQASKSPRPLKS